MALFPTFEAPQTTAENTNSTNEFEYKPSYSFDIGMGDFVIDGAGKSIKTDETGAWQQWCEKQLATERFACLAYNTDIGIEAENALAEKTKSAQQSAIERTIIECLMADPSNRTTRVDRFIHKYIADSLYTTFVVTGQNGQAIQLTKKWEV